MPRAVNAMLGLIRTKLKGSWRRRFTMLNVTITECPIAFGQRPSFFRISKVDLVANHQRETAKQP
jgi:hypothetical protein